MDRMAELRHRLIVMDDDLQHYDEATMDEAEKQRIAANEAQRETLQAELHDLEANEAAREWASQNGIGPEYSRDQEQHHER